MSEDIERVEFVSQDKTLSLCLTCEGKRAVLRIQKKRSSYDTHQMMRLLNPTYSREVSTWLWIWETEFSVQVLAIAPSDNQHARVVARAEATQSGALGDSDACGCWCSVDCGLRLTILSRTTLRVRYLVVTVAADAFSVVHHVFKIEAELADLLKTAVQEEP